MTAAIFAVPGDIATPTGGYAYARRLLEHAPGAGLELWHWPLPGSFPAPSPGDLNETIRRLQAAPAGWPLLIDGLALGAIPAGLLRALSAPIVALCHHPLALETGISAAQAEAFRQSERAALECCAAVITPSRATAQQLVHSFGVPAGIISVAHPGTDPAPRAKGSNAPEVHILSIGTLTPRKGHHLLIEALAPLRDLAWRLTIIGARDRDSAYAEALDQIIADLSLAERINLVGAVGSEALAGAYDSADLFALPSLFEGFGMVYTEAMARGLPVIGSRTAAIEEATQGGALLVEPGDVAALTEALRSVIGDADARSALASKAQGASDRFWRWSDTAREVTRVVGSVERVCVSDPAGAL